MPMTVEQLQEQREKILADMSSAQQTTFGDRSVTWRSQADLDAALTRIDREIARQSGPSIKQIVIVPKGF